MKISRSWKAKIYSRTLASSSLSHCLLGSKKEANGHWVFLQCVHSASTKFSSPSTLTELAPGLLQKMCWENSLPRTNTLLMIYGNGYKSTNHIMSIYFMYESSMKIYEQLSPTLFLTHKKCHRKIPQFYFNSLV